mmetsp:Transcript_41957/g.98474  ORF Transcript_41957/g.98474 Transcript_41957/m.98474 type:complete len:251 (-) Transcript_41957:63-815(-)
MLDSASVESVLCSARRARAPASLASFAVSTSASVRSAGFSAIEHSEISAPVFAYIGIARSCGIASRSMAQSVWCRAAFSSRSIETRMAVAEAPPASSVAPEAEADPTEGSESSLVESVDAARASASRPLSRSRAMSELRQAAAADAPERTYSAYAACNVSSASSTPDTTNTGPWRVACCGSYVVEGTSADTCSQSEASAPAVGASVVGGWVAPARAYEAERGLAATTDGRGVLTNANIAGSPQQCSAFCE